MALARVLRAHRLLRAAAAATEHRAAAAAASRLGARRQLAVASAARFGGADSAQPPAAATAAVAGSATPASSPAAQPTEAAESAPADLAAVGAEAAKVLTIADVLSTRESEMLAAGGADGQHGWFDEWESVAGSETVHDAIALMVERDIGSLIVTEGSAGVVGIVTERDVLTKLPPRTAHSAERLVRDIMSSHIMCIHPSTPVIDALATMTKENIRHLAVLHGELSTVEKKGSVPEEAMRCVLSITDILKAYSRFEAEKTATSEASSSSSPSSASPSSPSPPSSADSSHAPAPATTADGAPAATAAAAAAASPDADGAPATTAATTAATLLKKKAKAVSLILNTRPEDNVSVADAVEEMARHNFGAVLVVDKEQRVQGIFTERDYLTKVLFEHRDPAQVRLTAVASAVRTYLQIEDSLEKCWNVAVAQDCRHFPVIGVMRKDREKELAGILSIKDIVREISKGHETARGFRLMDFFKSRRDASKQEQAVSAAVAAAASAAPAPTASSAEEPAVASSKASSSAPDAPPATASASAKD